MRYRVLILLASLMMSFSQLAQSQPRGLSLTWSIDLSDLSFKSTRLNAWVEPPGGYSDVPASFQNARVMIPLKTIYHRAQDESVQTDQQETGEFGWGDAFVIGLGVGALAWGLNELDDYWSGD